MKILAFSGSNSDSSINRELVQYVIQHLNIPSKLIDLRDYAIPMFSIDLERENGFPNKLNSLYRTLKSYDAYIISIPEHNGNYPAFFKNILDWFTRVDSGFFKGKPILLLNASPGPNGGKSVLCIAEKSFPYFDGNVIAKFILPNCQSYKTDGEINIGQTEILKLFNETIDKFEQSLELAQPNSKTQKTSP